jgi:hypothetical protein
VEVVEGIQAEHNQLEGNQAEGSQAEDNHLEEAVGADIPEEAADNVAHIGVRLLEAVDTLPEVGMNFDQDLNKGTVMGESLHQRIVYDHLTSVLMDD